MLVNAKRSIVLALVLAAGFFAPIPAVAGSEYQCDKAGGNTAIVNACGARWQAANVRAHLGSGSQSNHDTACLTSYADLLEQLASNWAATKKYSEYTGPWPCGFKPESPDDDGMLAKACPNKVWSYGNAGIAGCIIAIAPTQEPTPAPATPAPIQTPPPMSADEIADRLTGDNAYRAWDGGGVGKGAYYDQVDRNRVSFSGCTFSVEKHVVGNNGVHNDSYWTGNLRDVDPSTFWLGHTTNSSPERQIFQFFSRGRAPAFQYSGATWPEAVYAVSLSMGNSPNPIIVPFQQLIRSCSR
jgi:hypothetical protein